MQIESNVRNNCWYLGLPGLSLLISLSNRFVVAPKYSLIFAFQQRAQVFVHFFSAVEPCNPSLANVFLRFCNGLYGFFRYALFGRHGLFFISNSHSIVREFGNIRLVGKKLHQIAALDAGNHFRSYGFLLDGMANAASYPGRRIACKSPEVPVPC